MGTFFDKVLFSHRNLSKARGNTAGKLLCVEFYRLHQNRFLPQKSLDQQSLWNTILGFYDIGQKVMYKPTVNHESRELTCIIRKQRNTAWIHDNNRRLLASDGQIAPKPTKTKFKTELSPNIGNDVTELPLSPVFTPYDGDRTKPYQTESHGKTEAELNPNSKIPNWFSLMGECGDVISDDREQLERRAENTISCSMPYTELGYKLHLPTNQR